jgi:nitrite reductase (NO-forming)
MRQAKNNDQAAPLLLERGNVSGADRSAEDSDQFLAGKESRKWVVRNVSWLKSFIRIFLGIVWLIDGYLKFSPGLVDSFPDLVRSAGDGQPIWLQPWFNFWSSVTTGNAALFVYSTGVLEVALGVALVLGFMRKVAYLGGMIFSLFIWAIPEGFGGPYGPCSTDIGTGIIYSFVLLSLVIINTISGPSKYSLDFLIERKYPFWKRLAEFG